MAVVDVDNLAVRMRRISEMTETLLGLQSPNEEARMLAAQVGHEIAVARLQIRLYPACTGLGRMLRFAS